MAVVRTNYPRHLPGFSYVGIHRYFLTFCTHDRARSFVDPASVDLVVTQFLRAASVERFELTAWCFMPDHVHLVVEGEEDWSDLKGFIRKAKQLSAYSWSQVGRGRLWQRYGYEHVLRDDEPTRRVVAYVLENPVRAKIVASVWEYPFVGSSKYTREQLIEYAYYSGDRSGGWSG